MHQVRLEFARLYGAGGISRETMLAEMGFLRVPGRSPPLVFESTPLQRPNAIMLHWIRSITDETFEPSADPSRVRGVVVPDLIYDD